MINNEKRWCVYVHTNKTNGKKYVGITCKKPEDRWQKGNGYRHNQYFTHAIKKYTWDGFKHEIVAENLIESDAKQKEIELIAFYKTNCVKYRNPTYGYNMTDGGDGTHGHILSDESKEKMKQSLKQLYANGLKPWNYGMSMSDDFKKKISMANKGRVISEDTRKKLSSVKKGMPPNSAGKPLSQKAKDKISKVKKGHITTEETKRKIGNANRQYVGAKSSMHKPIYCIELDEIFWGAKCAEDKYGINKTNIGKCCKEQRNYAGKHPNTGEKLHWIFIDKAIELNYISKKQLNNYLNTLN